METWQWSLVYNLRYIKLHCYNVGKVGNKMDFLSKNAKALVGLVVAGLAAYFTPEMITQFGLQAGELVQVGVIAALTAFVVWLVPNQQ